MKRKPPLDNVRRVRSFAGNLVGVTTNKAGRTVQMESQQESALCLLLDRDPNVKDYISQFKQFSYQDEQYKVHTYTPDYFVWTHEGQDEVHEVTVTSRDTQQRDKAAREICEENNWKFVRHDETTLPKSTELANLIFLRGFYPLVYRNDLVAQAIFQVLRERESIAFEEMLSNLTDSLPLSQGVILPAIYHLLWRGELAFDMTRFLLSDRRDRSQTILTKPRGC